MSTVAIIAQPKGRTMIKFLSRYYWTVEGMSGTAAALWGLWLLNPYWDTFGVSSAYQAMASIFPEWVWGLWMLLLGIIEIALLVSGQHRHLLPVLGLLSGTWFFISFTFILAARPSTGVPIYVTFTVFTGAMAYRLFKHERISA